MKRVSATVHARHPSRRGLLVMVRLRVPLLAVALLSNAMQAQAPGIRAVRLPVSINPTSLTNLADVDAAGLYKLGRGLLVVTTRPANAYYFDSQGALRVRLATSDEDTATLGKWRGPLSSEVQGADTLILRDEGRRVMFRRSIRSALETDPIPQPTEKPQRVTLIRGGTLMSGSSGQVERCGALLQSALRGSDWGAPVLAFVDNAGGTWIKKFDTAEWAYVSARGSTPVRISGLPSEFRLTDVVADTLLGVLNGVNSTVVPARFLAARPDSLRATGECRPVEGGLGNPSDREKLLTVRTTIREAMVKGDGFFIEHKRYPSTVEELKISVPEGIRLWILEHSRSGWLIGVGTNRFSVMCAVSFGRAVPTGWVEGVTSCS